MRYGGLAAQFFDLVLDCVGHGLNFVVGEGLKGAFDQFLAKGGVKEGEMFQLQARPPTFVKSSTEGRLALSPRRGGKFLVRGLGG